MSQIIGYARVSTPDQNLEIQRSRLLQAGAARVFTDTASGKSMDRPGWAALLNYVREGDTIALVRLDRLARSLRALLALVDLLRARGVGLMSLEERIDTTTPGGNLVLNIFGVLAEFERELIISRTRDALDIARARGKHIGRPPLAEDKINNAVTLVESAGLSPAEAAKAVGIGRTALYEVLRLRREAALARGEHVPKREPRKRLPSAPEERGIERSAGSQETKAAAKPRTRRGKGSKPPPSEPD